MDQIDSSSKADDLRKRRQRKQTIENLVQFLFLIITLLSIASLLVIMLFIFGNAIKFFGEYSIIEFLTGREWKPSNNPPLFGILPMIAGSLIVTAGAIVVGVPIGVATAIFMAYFCPEKIYKPLKAAVNLMAGIPSIIFGLFWLMIIVPIVRNFQQTFLGGGDGLTAFTAITLLGVMILPTIIGLSESSLRAVPNSIYQGALAVGATHERAVITTVVPAAGSGILASVILGIGRAIGETMAVVMVAGNQARMPKGLFDGLRTMTTNIVLEMNYASGTHKDALIATGAVLFVFILILNLAFNIVNKKGEDE